MLSDKGIAIVSLFFLAISSSKLSGIGKTSLLWSLGLTVGELCLTLISIDGEGDV
ncbi:exported hypothetical protein [Photobacterium kishitanii]|nr:exported hypothetical protein [Photobacterium kishitanii]